jgi:hypothetical protein
LRTNKNPALEPGGKNHDLAPKAGLEPAPGNKNHDFGAEGRTRTGTSFRPPPPQDGVSTNSTTSAPDYIYIFGQTRSSQKDFTM